LAFGGGDWADGESRVDFGDFCFHLVGVIEAKVGTRELDVFEWA
jgi:hypothetical protein